MIALRVRFVANVILPIIIAGIPIGVGAQQPPEDASALSKYRLLAISRNPGRASAGAYVLDPHHTSVTAKIAHMDLSRYTLRFNSVSGHFAYDPAHPAATRLEIVIDPKSIDTGDQTFNTKIATRYLEADRFPQITFTSTDLRISGDHGEITGVLDFHGVKKPVILHTIYRGFTRVDGQSRMGFSAEATFKRSDFGVGIWVPLEGDAVSLLIEAEFTGAN